MKELLIRGCSYFYGLFGCLWLGVLSSMISWGGLFFERHSTPAYILTIILMTLATCTGLFFTAKRKGYKEGKFHPKTTLASFGFTCLFQLLYAVLFSFSIYTTGAAFFLGEYIYSILYKIPTTGFPDVYKFMTMWIFDLIYLGIVILGERIGVKARLKDRKDLTGQ